jgi:hypothetical protein
MRARTADLIAWLIGLRDWLADHIDDMLIGDEALPNERTEV